MATNHETAVMYMLWQLRHITPAMSMRISDDDIKAFHDCCEFQNVEPKATIVERAPIDKDGILKPGYTVIALTDAAGNAITPVENNEADYAIAEKARNKERLAAGAKRLAEQVRGNAMNGDFSSSAIAELCDTVEALS